MTSRDVMSRALVRYESRVHASRFPSRAMLLGEQHEVLLCTLKHCSTVGGVEVSEAGVRCDSSTKGVAKLCERITLTRDK